MFLWQTDGNYSSIITKYPPYQFFRYIIHQWLLSDCTNEQAYRERGGSVVECRTPEREVGGSRPTAAVLCPWARHFTPRKYWLITQEAVAPSRYDWKIVDWDVKLQHKQNKTKSRHTCHFAVFAVLRLVYKAGKWAAAWQNQQNDLCAQRRLRSARYDQRLHCAFFMLSSCGQQRLWSDWANAQADPSLRWAHRSFCWFCRAAAQMFLLFHVSFIIVVPSTLVVGYTKQLKENISSSLTKGKTIKQIRPEFFIFRCMEDFLKCCCSKVLGEVGGGERIKIK